MANEKENAKTNVGLPTTIPVNAGTAGSVPTPQNLGVPTPPLPFDPMAAMNGVAPQGAPDANGVPPDPARGPTFPPSPDIEKTVQGMITHWDKENLKNLITYAAHLLTVEEKKSTAQAKKNK